MILFVYPFFLHKFAASPQNVAFATVSLDQNLWTKFPTSHQRRFVRPHLNPRKCQIQSLSDTASTAMLIFHGLTVSAPK